MSTQILLQEKLSGAFKYRLNCLADGARPQPRWGILQRSPDPLAGGERLATPPQKPHPRFWPFGPQQHCAEPAITKYTTAATHGHFDLLHTVCAALVADMYLTAYHVMCASCEATHHGQWHPLMLVLHRLNHAHSLSLPSSTTQWGQSFCSFCLSLNKLF